jgi:hypothetical protein
METSPENAFAGLNVVRTQKALAEIAFEEKN